MKIKKIAIFIGLKIAEIIGFGSLYYGLCLIGETEFVSTYLIEDSIPFLMQGIWILALAVLAIMIPGFIITVIWAVIIKNLEWSDKLIAYFEFKDIDKEK